MSPVEKYIENAGPWREILILLRKELLAKGLEETIKWNAPAYTLDGKNLIGLMAFKSYAGLWFHQGMFLKDKARVLTKADDNVKAMRSWRFDLNDEIPIELLRAYIQETIANHKAGKVLKPQSKPLEIPALLQKELDAHPPLKAAFESFNLTLKREFCHYVSTAKREETRLKRLDVCIDYILAGRGIY